MARPFHYSFFVTDLASTRRFYGEVLGSKEGRSAATWVDFDFFGNQLSMHASAPPVATAWCGEVDGIKVPMPHFGAILGWDEFHSVAERLRGAGVSFVIEPRSRFVGQPGEQATMFFLDPSGNALELKAFRHPEHVFDQ